MALLRPIASRVVALVPVVLGITVLVFALNAIALGDPARAAMGQRADPETLEWVPPWLPYRLETLADELAALTSEPLASPFSRELVVVQSRGVARWLSLKLADHRGVCANVEFPFPNAYAWALYRAVLGQVPDRSQFDPAVTEAFLDVWADCAWPSAVAS